MAQNKVNMSLDEIIKNTNKNTRGRGSFRNRGGRRGGGRGRGGGAEVRNRSRSRSRNRLGVRGGGVAGRGRGAVRGRGGRGRGATGRLSRRDMSGFGGSPAQNRSRSASRNRGGGNNIQRTRSQSRNRNQQGNNNNNPRRGRSQSRNRGAQNNTTQRQRSRSRSRGRINTIQNTRGGRGRGRGRGISKISRNRLLATGISTEVLRAKKLNSFSQVGLRSDQIIQAQKMKRVQNKVNIGRNQNNVIRSQTFTRTRTLPAAAATSLTVSVANEFAGRRKLNRKRKNSQVGYLDKASLEKLTELLGGSTIVPRGTGSVRSMGSNRSKRSNRSMRSNTSRGRGRGKKNFSLQKTLNPRLQQQIAQIQGKTFSNGASEFSAGTSGGQPGINFTPTPHLTTTSLSDRFGKM